MNEWISIYDSADYNLTEIMSIHNCTKERAIEIAIEYFYERNPNYDIFESEES